MDSATVGPREINNVCAFTSSSTNRNNFGAYLIGLLWGLKETLRAGGEGDDRGWDGWMASLTQWTWVWVTSRSWWWTGRLGVLRFVGSQRVGHDWATELNWSECVYSSTWPMGNTIQMFTIIIAIIPWSKLNPQRWQVERLEERSKRQGTKITNRTYS